MATLWDNLWNTQLQLEQMRYQSRQMHNRLRNQMTNDLYGYQNAPSQGITGTSTVTGTVIDWDAYLEYKKPESCKMTPLDRLNARVEATCMTGREALARA